MRLESHAEKRNDGGGGCFHGEKTEERSKRWWSLLPGRHVLMRVCGGSMMKGNVKSEEAGAWFEPSVRVFSVTSLEMFNELKPASKSEQEEQDWARI